MENYYFCNFLGNKMDRSNTKGITSVEVTDELSESVQEAEAYISGNTLKFVKKGEKCDGEKFDFIGSFNTTSKVVPCTEEALRHTEDNPLIIVATKRFKVFNGTPSYIKYIPVEDGVIVALLKGCISVEDGDGEMIPLSRDYSGSPSGEGYIYTSKDMNGLNSLEDKESDVAYSDYVVSDCVISVDVSKDGRLLRGAKFSKDNFSVMYNEIFEEGKVRKHERLRKKEEERLLKEASIKRFYEERKRKEEEAKKSAGEQKSKGATKKKKNESVSEGATGAQAFLAFVDSLKEQA